MKFIHCADLHLDSAMSGFEPEIAKTRKEEILRSFERLCALAEKENVTAVIIAGDMFDGEKVYVKTRQRVINAIKSAANVDFLYLSGNHDKDGFSSGEDLPENFKVFGTEWTYFSYGNTVVAGVNFNGFNKDSVYDTLKLSRDKINIAVMHGQIAGYNTEVGAELVSLPRLKDKFIDYLALGHIHAFSDGAIDERGRYAYSGCLDGRGFDETGEKGFVLINVQENGKLSYSFVPFCSRVLREVPFDISPYSSQYEAVQGLSAALLKTCAESDLIKVVLNGERTPDFYIDTSFIAQKLSENFFFVKVYDKTSLKVDIRDYEADKSLRGEFVRKVLSSSLDEADKTAIVNIGLTALKGEEL